MISTNWIELAVGFLLIGVGLCLNDRLWMGILGLGCFLLGVGLFVHATIQLTN